MRLRQKLTIKPKLKPVTRIRIASFIELGEKKFSEFVIEVENDPVFKKLLSADDEDRRVITCRNFPRAVFDLNNLSIKEQISGDGSPVDVETLLSEKNDLAALIKKIGLDDFQKYFLSGETAYPEAEISGVCGISAAAVKRINDFVNDLSVRSEFYHPSTLGLESRINYSRIAKIEYDGKGDFFINFFSPKYVSGRYVINKTRLNALKKQNAFPPEDLGRINRLMEKLELINERKTTIYQIIRKIVEVQKNYLYSGEEKFLVPYPQNKLSADTGIDSSVICRAIYGRSIVTPREVEKPLKFFFPGNKDVRKKLIQKIMSSEPRGLTDGSIAAILKDEFNISVSRRTVNVCRNELQGKKTS